MALSPTFRGARLIDHHQPARIRLAAAWAAYPGSILIISLAIAVLTSTPVRAGSRSAIDDPPPTLPLRVYLPAIYSSVTAAPAITHTIYLPLIARQPAPEIVCPSSSAATWGAMQPLQSFISGAAGSPDLNMTVRGWYGVDEFLGFVRYAYPPDEPPDTVHPLLLSNIAGSTVSAFVSTQQANDWDWSGCNCGVPRSPSPYPVTMLGLHTTPGQPLKIARRNLPVDPAGFKAMVLYADAGQLALKYTAEDRVDNGYLVHLVNLCVDPNLVDLYQRLDAEGRRWLPAVDDGSVVGIARGGEVNVIVRDSGAFMDPRSRQDWWQDQPPPPDW
jgi:hypothetical protein